MNVLAIDTSLAPGSVAALVRSAAGIRREERPLGPAGEHARRLMTELSAAADACGWRLAEADLVAVVRGPGSFTGLRVGVTAAKALCWSTGARLVGVPGFEVVARRTAEAMKTGGQVAVAFDAGRGDVYAAAVTAEPGSPSDWSVGTATLAPAGSWLASIPPGACVSGPALEALADAARDRGLAVAPREAWFPTASDAATIALCRADAGTVDDPHTLLPEYSRPSYAEEKSPRSSG